MFDYAPDEIKELKHKLKVDFDNDKVERKRQEIIENIKYELKINFINNPLFLPGGNSWIEMAEEQVHLVDQMSEKELLYRMEMNVLRRR